MSTRDSSLYDMPLEDELALSQSSENSTPMTPRAPEYMTNASDKGFSLNSRNKTSYSNNDIGTSRRNPQPSYVDHTSFDQAVQVGKKPKRPNNAQNCKAYRDRKQQEQEQLRTAYSSKCAELEILKAKTESNEENRVLRAILDSRNAELEQLKQELKKKDEENSILHGILKKHSVFLVDHVTGKLFDRVTGKRTLSRRDNGLYLLECENSKSSESNSSDSSSSP